MGIALSATPKSAIPLPTVIMKIGSVILQPQGRVWLGKTRSVLIQLLAARCRNCWSGSLSVLLEEFLLEPVVVALLRHELLVRSLLHHLAVVQEDDVVRSLHRLQSVGDHQNRLALGSVQDRLDLTNHTERETKTLNEHRERPAYRKGFLAAGEV